ncbi:MAG: putative metal-binding motif-containing protein [Myxococcota bacterium]|nr:putative metal-binding motif-containing protein [Myxococcota bacterium]
MSRIVWTVAVFGLSACVGGDIDERRNELSDVDQDGYIALEYGGVDCNDGDRDINPGEEEIPYDGVDNDCDGETPDDDRDGDSFGIENDCDDTDETIYPNAPEICDGIDNNCDQAIDEAGAEGESTFYADSDGDGYGNLDEPIQACTQPEEGYTTNSDDCNDEDALAYPGSTERCSTDYDDDCDSEANEQDAEGCTNYFYDGDGDGYGTTEFACFCEPDTEGDYDALVGTDCLDTNPNAYPDAIEVINDSEDYDCDGGDDTFGFQSIDNRGSLDAYGPRLRADGDAFYLTWIAEEYDDGSGLSYDGGMILEFDAQDPLLGETDALSFGTGTNGVTFTEKFDFVATQDYWVVATGGVNGAERRLRLEFVDRGNGSRDTYETTTTTNATWSDIQLGYSTNGSLTTVACGLGNAGLKVLQATVTQYINASGVYETTEPWPSDVCEYNDGSYAYYLANSSTQLLNYAAYFTNTQMFMIYQYFIEMIVGDIEVARSSSEYTAALAYTKTGKHYLQIFNGSSGLATKTMASEVADLDVALTPTAGSAVCTVANNGDLHLLYADIDSNESLEEVSLTPGVVVDECAIASTNDGRLALGIRSGDDFMIGFFDYL